MRFLVVIFMLYSGSVFASVRCDALLAGLESHKSESSYFVSAYVNLLKHYIEQSQKDLDQSLVETILTAKAFVNPFASKKDSLSLQISAGMKQVSAGIDEKSWSEVQNAVRDFLKVSGAEQVDKAEKEHDTSFVLNPHLLPPEEIGLQASRISFHRVGDNVYVAETRRDGKLRLHKYVNGKYIFLSEQTFFGISSPAWVTVGGKVFLAASENTIDVGASNSPAAISFSTSFNLYLFELKNDQFEKRYEYKTSGKIVKFVLQVFNERLLLAATFQGEGRSASKDVHLYELTDDRMQLLSSLNGILESLYISLSWQVVNGRAFLAVNSGKGLKIYEFHGDQFLPLTSYELGPGESFQFSPAWQVIDGRVFVAIAVQRAPRLLGFDLFELKNDRLELKRTYENPYVLSAAPSWHVYKQHVFLAAVATASMVGSPEMKLSLYDIRKDQFELKYQAELKAFTKSDLRWQIEEDGNLSIKICNVGDCGPIFGVQVFKKLEKQRGRQ